MECYPCCRFVLLPIYPVCTSQSPNNANRSRDTGSAMAHLHTLNHGCGPSRCHGQIPKFPEDPFSARVSNGAANGVLAAGLPEEFAEFLRTGGKPAVVATA